MSPFATWWVTPLHVENLLIEGAVASTVPVCLFLCFFLAIAP